MKKVLFLAALLMASSSAHAGMSMDIQGKRIEIDMAADCKSLTCLKVSAPGLANRGNDDNKAADSDARRFAEDDRPSGPRRRRFDDDRRFDDEEDRGPERRRVRDDDDRPNFKGGRRFNDDDERGPGRRRFNDDDVAGRPNFQGGRRFNDDDDRGPGRRRFNDDDVGGRPNFKGGRRFNDDDDRGPGRRRFNDDDVAGRPNFKGGRRFNDDDDRGPGRRRFNDDDDTARRDRTAPGTPPAPPVTTDTPATPPAHTDAAPPAPAPVAAATPERQHAPAAAEPASDPNSPVGVWAAEDNKGNVRIEQCGDNLCGYAEKSGEKVLINMKPQGSKWAGRIQDPDSGRKYDATIAMKGNGTLRVQGCAFGGMFCGGQTWKRVS